MGSIGKPISIPLGREYIGGLCAYSHFDLFQFRNNQLTKLAIKLIDIVSGIECTAGLEQMVLLVCQQRIPVAA